MNPDIVFEDTQVIVTRQYVLFVECFDLKDKGTNDHVCISKNKWNQIVNAVNRFASPGGRMARGEK